PGLLRGHDGLVVRFQLRGSRVLVSKPDSIEDRHVCETGAHQIQRRVPSVLLLVWNVGGRCHLHHLTAITNYEVVPK
ncbi:hypothetical protein AVEN_21256-1, partial [Araneus ventricosus]